MGREYTSIEYAYMSGYHTAIRHRMIHKRTPEYQGRDKTLGESFGLGVARAGQDEKLFKRIDMLEGARGFSEGREVESKTKNNPRYARGVEIARGVLEEFRMSHEWSTMHNQNTRHR